MIDTPKLTVDVVVRIWSENRFRGIVLVERKNEPRGLALPGGFVDKGESVRNAALWEMKEETNLEVRLDYLLGVYSRPDRDPRFHTVSVVFTGDADRPPVAGSDAEEARVYAVDQVPGDELVFDHAQILDDFLRGRRGVVA